MGAVRQVGRDDGLDVPQVLRDVGRDVRQVRPVVQAGASYEQRHHGSTADTAVGAPFTSTVLAKAHEQLLGFQNAR
jgi:pyruvate/2-oxoglutarate dehydrogenase complex dihydrolipoamide acyltransferase (E2) component